MSALTLNSIVQVFTSQDFQLQPQGLQNPAALEGRRCSPTQQSASLAGQ